MGNLNKIILIFLVIISGHGILRPQINIKGFDEQQVQAAINIIAEELVSKKIYTKNQIDNALAKNGPIYINFVLGEFDDTKNKYCIKKKAKHLVGKCLRGYYSGTDTLELINKGRLYDSSLAHEIFHYLQKKIDGKGASKHEPKKLWRDLFGYHVNNKIGSINETVKKAGL